MAQSREFDTTQLNTIGVELKRDVPLAGFTTMNVGERNTQFVLDYLATERIPVVSQDVLDIHPRKVCFFPVTGKALVKRLAHSHPETLAVEERRGNAASVAKSNAGGSVDLF